MWLTPSQGPGESHSRRLASRRPPLISTVANRLARCLSGIEQLPAHAQAALEQAAGEERSAAQEVAVPGVQLPLQQPQRRRVP